MELYIGLLFLALMLLLVVTYVYTKGRDQLYVRHKNLEGKTVIVTGAEKGKWFNTVLELAKRRGRIIMTCADKTAGESARQRIVKLTGNTNVVYRELDVSQMSSVRAFVTSFKISEKKLDILINNAEMCTRKRTVTKEGLELIFATNFFGPYLLTTLLLDLLKKSHGRVVNVGSVLPASIELDCENLRAEKGFHSQRFYQSKLALLMFTKELARRTVDSGVAVTFVHSGLVQAELYTDISWVYLFLQSIIAGQCVKTPLEGATSILFCALDDSVQTGGYYMDCRLYDQNVWVPKCAYDEGLARKLWEISERLTASSDVIGQLRERLSKGT
ncbi:retinol dehydrogenase 11-like [Saccostrea echinata]|uniref:retinol dehydrogenase 11-like n=1 Tax=Saccostrea echinata TaxID=191078 RepID=UPI002A802A29|nr:retinol dehydrogenase 11-like [Saccostrea echinata]